MVLAVAASLSLRERVGSTAGANVTAVLISHSARMGSWFSSWLGAARVCRVEKTGNQREFALLLP